VGHAALAVAFRSLLEPGAEAIFLTPPWFFYELLILAADGVPVRVRLEPPAFDLDLDALEAAITPRTRAVLLNSPHNPSGRVYAPNDLRGLAGLLTDASDRIGSPIYLISDEPYNRILFDGRSYHSPAEAYPYTRGRLLVRQDAADPWHAHRLPRRAAHDARSREVAR